MAQIAFQRHASPRRLGFQLGGIDPGAGAALPLGGDQRQFGILDQGEGIFALRAGGQADAAGREDCGLSRPIGLAAGFHQRIADGLAARGADWRNSKAKLSPPTRKICAGSPKRRSAARRHLQDARRRRHRPGWHEWP